MQAARLIVLGGALGLVAAFAASKLLASLQVGVTSPDAVSFSLAWALMTAVAVVASEPRGCTPSSRWRWAGLTVTCISSRLEGPLTPNPGFDLDTFEDDPKISDERQTTFQKIAPKLKSVLVYEYDFGDSWDYFITVEKILPADPAVAPGAECLDGTRACPPEDCGGVCGHADLLKILRDPGHEEHESMLGWLGRPFSEVFNRDSTNKHLRMLPWPKTTESQLRRVLMRGDGFKA